MSEKKITQMEELRKWQRAREARLRAQLEASERFFATALEAMAEGGDATIPMQPDASTRRALADETPTRRLLLVHGAEYWLQYEDGVATVRADGVRSKRLGPAVPDARDGLVDADEQHFAVRAGGHYWELDYDLRKHALQPFASRNPVHGAYVGGRFIFYSLGAGGLELANGDTIPQEARDYDHRGTYPLAPQGGERALIVVHGKPQRWRLTHWEGSPVRVLPFDGQLLALYGGHVYYF